MYLKVLRDKLGHIPIRDFGTVEMQDYLRGWLNDLAAKQLSKSYIQHVLIYLRASLNEAAKRQLVHYNYATELKVPSKVKEVDHRFLSEDQVAAYQTPARTCNGPHFLDKYFAFLRWWAALKIEESQCPKRVRVTRPA
jgi:hypothetical protein